MTIDNHEPNTRITAEQFIARETGRFESLKPRLKNLVITAVVTAGCVAVAIGAVVLISSLGDDENEETE